MNETDIKKECIKVLKKLGVFNYAIPAGYFSKKGLPDRVAHINKKVVYLEFKAEKGKQSHDQKEFEEQCERDYIPYFLIKSVEDLKKIL